MERKKRSVPVKVRGYVREVYKKLLEEDDDFNGFDVKKRFADSENQGVMKRLITEMKTLDSSVPQVQVMDAGRRFFQSKVEEQSLKDKGKYSIKVTQQRRQNRIKRKLELRKSVFVKSNMSDQQREIYNKVLVKNFMSSEDSGTETVDGKQKAVLKVKPLPWRSPRCSKFLDNKIAKEKKSRQSVQQTLPRVTGALSARPKPYSFPADFWGFDQEQ